MKKDQSYRGKRRTPEEYVEREVEMPSKIQIEMAKAQAEMVDTLRDINDNTKKIESKILGRERNVALFIDHDNLISGGVEYDRAAIISIAKRYGRISNAKVYFDVGGESSESFYNYFLHGVQMVYAPKWKYEQAGGKSIADPMLMCDIIEALHDCPWIDVFVIVTGDKDFVIPIRKIAEHGKYAVIIARESRLADVLVKECERNGFDVIRLKEV
ncbi:MAG: NYN domain-containing protein [Thermoplasmata archaeon]